MGVISPLDILRDWLRRSNPVAIGGRSGHTRPLFKHSTITPPSGNTRLSIRLFHGGVVPYGLVPKISHGLGLE
jgi:hypothetical protein